MEKTIWRGISVLLMSLPIAWIGHSADLKDQALIKTFTSVDQFQLFYATQVSVGGLSGYIGISVLCFVYLLICETIATGLMTGFGKLVKKNNQPPTQAAQDTARKLADPGL